MNKIVYCGKDELAKAMPGISKDTKIVTLSDYVTEVQEAEQGYVASHVIYPFKVLDPQGPDGSYRPMDEQAAKIGEFLREFLKDHTGDIIIQCSYGEIRSPAVAVGLYHSLEKTHQIGTFKNGKFVEEYPQRSSTFQGRTSANVHDVFEERYRRVKNPNIQETAN